MKDGDANLAGTTSFSEGSTALSMYGIGTGLGQSAIANLLNRDIRVAFVGPSLKLIRWPVGIIFDYANTSLDVRRIFSGSFDVTDLFVFLF